MFDGSKTFRCKLHAYLERTTVKRILVAIATLAAAGTMLPARAETPAELTERLLATGKLAEAESSLAGIVKDHPDDAEAHFGLGVTRFLHSVERLSQSYFGRIRLDLDGKATPEERLWKLFLVLNGQMQNRVTAEQCEAFDRGDVAWLREACGRGTESRSRSENGQPPRWRAGAARVISVMPSAGSNRRPRRCGR